MNEPTKKNTVAASFADASIGALYGLLMGSTFVLVAAFIDRLLHSELPIGVDWDQVLARWLLIGGGIALIGAVTSGFAETAHGFVAGTILAGLLALTTALFLSSVGTGMKLIVLIFILVPVAVMCLPLVWLLRSLARQHGLILQKGAPWWRFAVLILLAITVGAIGGYFMKMSDRALVSMQVVHENMQAAPENQDRQIRQVPDLEQHTGMRYVLFQKPSSVSAQAADVRVVYDDSYTIQCVVMVYPGQDPFIRSCEQTD